VKSFTYYVQMLTHLIFNVQLEQSSLPSWYIYTPRCYVL